MRPVSSLLVFALVIVGAWLAAVLLLQRSVLYPRPPAAAHAPASLAESERVRLGEAPGVEAFFLRPSADAAPFPVVLFTHGNGELIDHWIGPFRELAAHGVAVLLVEYPGYGRSAGSPSEASITRTIFAAYDFLRTQPDVDPTRLVAYGRSLGGGAACALAAARPVAALVLESTFTSVRALAQGMGVPGPMVLDPWDNLSVVEGTETPILVLHGERDRVIPFAHGEALARAAGTGLVRMRCGHNDCPRPWADILGFLRAHAIVE
jgi:pimeloyl-ACP methyl ester carboxylesterase